MAMKRLFCWMSPSAETYAPVTEIGFVTNDQFGFVLGYSPDGLVGDDGLIECKSRCQKYQIQTLTDMIAPDEFMLQLQTGLLVTGRKWIDFVSYCGGLPMVTIRVHPDPDIQGAIIHAASIFEAKIAEKRAVYDTVMASNARLIPTERVVEVEMF